MHATPLSGPISTTVTVTSENLSTTRRAVTVTVPAAATQAEEAAVLREFARNAAFPGFRPGKAPVDMIRRRYAQQIADESRQRVARKAYDEAVKGLDRPLAAVVKVDGGEFSTARDETITFTIDIQPDVAVPPYEGLALPFVETKVLPEEVDREISNLRRERGTFEVVDRAAEKGDYVKVSYTGRVEGQLIADVVLDRPMWGTQKNTWEEAGAEPPLGVPAVVAALVGMKAGDTRTVETTFAENHEVEDLRNKAGTYEVEVHEVRQRVLAEMTDDFLKDLKVESVEALRESIGQRLSQGRQQERLDAHRRAIADALLASVDFDLPESAVEAETDRVMTEIVGQNLRRGLTQEQLEQHKEEIHANAVQAATSRLKLDSILLKIAETEKVELSNDELSRAIYLESNRRRVAPDTIVKELQKDRSALDRLRRDLTCSKTLSLIASKGVEATPENPLDVGAASAAE